MIGYIKSPKTFQNVRTVNVLSYELPLEADISESGSVTVEGVIGDQYERMLLVLDGFPKETFVIGESSASFADNNGTSVLNLYPWQKVLDDCYAVRFEYQYTDDFGQTLPFTWAYAGQIQDIREYFPDLYAPDYVTRAFQTYSGSVRTYLSSVHVPDTCYTEVDTGSRAISGYRKFRVYELAKFTNEILKTRVRFNVSWPLFNAGSSGTEAHACLHLSDPSFAYEASVTLVFFKDGHSELKTFSLSDNCTGIVSAFIGLGSETGHADDFYYCIRAAYILRNDGSVHSIPTITSRMPDTQQKKGVSALITKSYGNTTKTRDTILTEVKALAAEEFAKNTYEHKAEFCSDKRFYLGQPVRLVFDDFTFDTAISKVMLSSGDDRYHYYCGDLPVTASEHISANGWKYGARLPVYAKKGTLFIKS